MTRVSTELTELERAETALADAQRRETEVAADLIASEQRYRTLIASIDDGFCEIQQVVEGDRIDYRYLDVNAAFVAQSGLRDVVGRTIRQVVTNDVDVVIDNYNRVIASGQPIRFERASFDRHFEVNAVPTSIAQRRIGVLFKDVTKRRAAEQALRDNQARLEEASRAKDDFIAMLGHELRNPLAPIDTALTLMELRDPTAFVKERAVIGRQVVHLSALVEDLLDVSRITSKKLELSKEVVTLETVIANAVELASPLIEERKHRLAVAISDAPSVLGDGRRLAQVIANLLTNAAKYTNSGGAIDVKAMVDGDFAVIAVSDNGVGISSELLPHVFQPFVQAKQSIDRGRGGLGLGLAIVHALVAAHDGTVAADSRGLDRGSTFSVRLPLARSVHPTAQPRRDAAVVKQRRVLVVDDNVDAAELLCEVLEMNGHITRLAHDGPSALVVIEDFAPDVAVLDIGLPVMDGYELGRLLRERLGLEQLVLIALTGYGQDSDRERSARAGFDAHLVKPLTLAQLDEVLLRTH